MASHNLYPQKWSNKWSPIYFQKNFTLPGRGYGDMGLLLYLPTYKISPFQKSCSTAKT
jgi:hypothetical protein